MVRPGWKFHAFCFSAAVFAEVLKMTGRTQNGADYVYGVIRPGLQDAISHISEEEYQEMMRVVNTARRSIYDWAIGYLAPLNTPPPAPSPV